MYPRWFCDAGAKQADNNSEREKHVFIIHMAHYSLRGGSSRQGTGSLSRLYTLHQVEREIGKYYLIALFYAYMSQYKADFVDTYRLSK